MSGYIARGMTTPTPISRGEFGIVGARRILPLLQAQKIPTTWFIPGFTIETYPEACTEVVQGGHEIGHHGWTHVQPALLDRAQEESEMIRANDAIARLCGQRAQGYRSPAWDLSPHTLELLIQHGFYYESSMMGHDYSPYRVRQGDVIELQKPMLFGAAKTEPIHLILPNKARKWMPMLVQAAPLRLIITWDRSLTFQERQPL